MKWLFWLALAGGLVVTACSKPQEAAEEEAPQEAEAAPSEAPRAPPAIETVDAPYAARDYGADEPRPAMRAGQSATYVIHWRGGSRSRMRVAVESQEGDTWWVRLTDRRRTSEQILRLQVRPREATLMQRPELLQVEITQDGETTRMPSRLLEAQRGMFEIWIDTAFWREEGEIDPEVITTLAGNFSGARKSQATLTFPGAPSMELQLWRHPAVPLGGIVQFLDPTGDHRIELESFQLAE